MPKKHSFHMEKSVPIYDAEKEIELELILGISYTVYPGFDGTRHEPPYPPEVEINDVNVIKANGGGYSVCFEEEFPVKRFFSDDVNIDELMPPADVLIEHANQDMEDRKAQEADRKRDQLKNDGKI